MTLFSCILAILLAAPFGNSLQPVTSTQKLEQISADTVRLVFNLRISDGWHVYSSFSVP